MAILCERHTTSKITAFEDLTSIETYGFRGEALASISHIAHLTVTTKTEDSTLAWRAHYLDGRLAPAKPGQSAEPKAVAGRPGTQISVEDLFFNVPTRRRAFRSPSDEYNKIVDMVGRYAIHCQRVGFTCKKVGDSSNSLSIQAEATYIDRIRQIYGSNVANELVQIKASSDRWGFTADAYVTNANYHIKRTTLLLFINHRCVESTPIKKAIEQTYSSFLPKGGHPFVYLSLQIDPARVDVNVHPTKREVHFLNEDEIIQAICTQIEVDLSAVDVSRTFKTQTLLPGARAPEEVHSPSGEDTFARSTGPNKKARRNSNDLVRTDTAERKITSMFSAAEEKDGGSLEEVRAAPEAIEYDTNDLEYVECRLKSVKHLRAEVREVTHNELTDVFASHTFVGIVDEHRRLAAIQSGVKLYLVDYGQLCFEYLYQVGLTDFGNFGSIRFSPALDLRDLLRMAAVATSQRLGVHVDGFDVPSVVDKVADQLIERREMLHEYFSLEISPAGQLNSIPLMVKGYTPPMSKLPQFLLNLGPNVNWAGEKACFETFLKELAIFYVPEKLAMGSKRPRENTDEDVDEEIQKRAKYVRWAIEHVFFPSFKLRLVATSALMDGSVLEIANLKGLYRVFERC